MTLIGFLEQTEVTLLVMTHDQWPMASSVIIIMMRMFHYIDYFAFTLSRLIPSHTFTHKSAC